MPLPRPHPQATFFWICYAMCVGVMGTALASPLYPLYQAAWNLRPSDITHIFVVYMFGVLAVLLFMGRLTARFGFLAILRLGLVLMTAGVALSAVAGSVPVFMAARLVIGMASGMISTSAATGLVQVGGDRDPRRADAVEQGVSERARARRHLGHDWPLSRAHELRSPPRVDAWIASPAFRSAADT